jgi:hypothetical protein
VLPSFCSVAAASKVKAQTFLQVTRQLKQNWLVEGGRDLTQPAVQAEEWPAIEAEVCSEHLQHYFRFMQWSFKVPSVQLLEPELLLTLFELEADPAVETRMLYQKAAQAKLEQAGTLLVPCCSAAHWSLLAVTKGISEGQTEVRYYDTLTQESVSCRALAQFCLDLLLPGSQVPDRRNMSRQVKGSSSCGYWACWYFEEEVRKAAGEQFGSRGWPSEDKLQEVKKNIANIVNILKLENALNNTLFQVDVLFERRIND